MLNWSAMTVYMHIVTMIVAATAALAAAVAVWAGESRRYWFWRALAVWACVAIMLPIRAYEPAMVLAVSLPLIALTVLAMRRVAQHQPAEMISKASQRWLIRFGLRDVLLATAMLGLTLATALYVYRRLSPDDGWPRAEKGMEILMPAIAMALVAALGWRLVHGRRRWPAFVGMAVAVVAGARYLPDQADWLYALDSDTFGILSTVPDRDELAYRAALTGFAEFAALATSLVWCFGCTPRWRPIGRCAGYAALVCMCLPITVAYIPLLTFTPFPPGRALSPGEIRIIEITERMKAINEDSLPTNELEATDPAVAAEVRQLYAELLPLLEDSEGLVNDLSRQTVEQLRNHLNGEEGKTVRCIARALSAEAKTAGLQGDSERSGNLAIASIRLGAAYCRDAILIGDLFGRVTTMYGYRNLVSIRSELNEGIAKRVSATLRSVEAGEQPPATLVERDIAYCERAFGWQCRLAYVIGRRLKGDPSTWDDFAAHIKGNQTWRAINRLLQTDLAIRAFQHDCGRLPNGLDELIPNYLPAPLVDPFTDRPLLYRMSGDEFVLYSVGKDGVDDGGNFAKQSDYQSELANRQYRREHSRGYDLDLEMLTRP